MRVLHLSFSDKNGGAAIGAYRLHLAMRARGVESEMLVIHKESSDTSVRPLLNSLNQPDYTAALAATREIRDLYGTENPAIRSINIHGLDLAERINQHPSEIVQLHWIANNTVKLSDLPKINKPIVWKMPDMWPFSGGEHYIRHGDPERHVAGYDKTAPFEGEAVDVNRFVWEAKRQYYKDLPLTITSPSRFLAEEAHKSVLFSPYDAHVIPNPLPWQFLMGKPAQEAERQELRRKLGLPQDKLIVMFSAFSSKEQRKGFHHIEEMVARHLLEIAPPSNLAFMVCGGKEAGREKIANYDVFTFAATQDVDLYKRYLRASDLLLFPSEMDSTAMVVQEALSQGVPSIVFNVGGLPEMVEHEKNGYVVEPYNAAGLADGIAWWIACETKDDVAAFAIDRARAMHDPAKTVERYLKVYDEALSRYRRQESFKTGKFHPDPAPVAIKPDEKRAVIIDPSAVSVTDSSHHSEHVMAFAALFEASGIKPLLVVNSEATIENPYGGTEKALRWTAYDKIRLDRDKRDGPSVDAELIRQFDSDSQKSLEIYQTLSRLDDSHRLTWRDVIVFPTTDRFCLEGALAYIYARQEYDSPSFHFNIMFEKAEFLLGRYPLDRMMDAVRASTYAGKKIFLYAETQQMADELSAKYDLEFRRLPPPGVFTQEQLEAVSKFQAGYKAATEDVRGAYAKATQAAAPSGEAAAFSPPRGKKIIASLGRGRRDKGWGLLPDIVEAFNETHGASAACFVVQRPRKMDNLEAEESRMEKFANVVMLDEIIPQALLDDVCNKADVFLLPYETGVYRNRGSAFGWRAVLNAKPLVVTAGTALCETLLASAEEPLAKAPDPKPDRFAALRPKPKKLVGEKFLNGKSASGAKGFADALSDVLSNLRAYEEGSEAMRAKYFISVVAKNPIIAGASGENFAADRHVLVLRDEAAAMIPPDESSEGCRIDMIYSAGDDGKDRIWLTDAGSQAAMMVSHKLRDGAIDPDNFPAFIVDSLNRRRIDRIYVPADLAIEKGGLRSIPPAWMKFVELY